jgi:isopentenyl-diphosphate delta-isomerase
MGFSSELQKAFDFTYRSEFDNGLTEFEFDHVFVGEYNDKVKPNKEEVSDYCFKSLDEIKSSLSQAANKYTAWFHIAFPMLEKWIIQNGKQG